MKKADPSAQKVARLAYLSGMIAKYAHCWGESPSQRMFNWVDEFEALRTEDREVWARYCAKFGFCLSHNAYDCLA